MSNRSFIADDPTSCDVQYAREGDAVAFDVVVDGVVTGITSPTLKFFKKGSNTDLASTYFTGSNSVSGTNTINTKTTQNLKAGEWIISVGGTVDGMVQNVATIPFYVKRESDL